MRTLLRALAVGCLALPVLPLTGAAAHAATTTEAPGTGAYYWSGKLPSSFSLLGQSLPNPVNGQDTDLDGVARDDLAVAVVVPGSSDKETFLLWDLLDLDENDTITKFVVTLPLTEKGPSSDTPQNTLAYGGTPDLDVCASKGGFGETDAGTYDTKPEVDTEQCVVATYDDGKKAYTADITKIAAGWLTGDNFGVAVVPADTAVPFQVVFQPTAKHSAAITFTPGADPVEEDLSVTPGDVGAGETSGGGFDTGGFDTGGFDSGGFGGDAGGVDLGGTGSVESPVVDTALPPAEAAGPAEAPAVAQPAQVAPVALASVPGGPPLGFWLAALGLGLLLLLVSFVTGAEPSAAARRRDGRVLAQIQRSSAAVAGAPVRRGRLA